MFAKRFFYVCAGLLCLALAYHFGATSATAQSAARVSGFSTESLSHFVMTPNGDVFYRGILGGTGPYGPPPTFIGNFWQP